MVDNKYSPTKIPIYDRAANLVPGWIPQERYNTFILTDIDGKSKVGQLGLFDQTLHLLTDNPSHEGKITDTDRVIADAQGIEYFVRTLPEIIGDNKLSSTVMMNNKNLQIGSIISIVPLNDKNNLKQMRAYISDIINLTPNTPTVYVYNIQANFYAFTWNIKTVSWIHVGPSTEQYYTLSF